MKMLVTTKAERLPESAKIDFGRLFLSLFPVFFLPLEYPGLERGGFAVQSLSANAESTIKAL